MSLRVYVYMLKTLSKKENKKIFHFVIAIINKWVYYIITNKQKIGGRPR